MKWHGTLAYYSKRMNLVKERRVANFPDYEQARQWVSNHCDKPVYVWCDNPVNTDNPVSISIWSEKYSEEYCKIID